MKKLLLFWLVTLVVVSIIFHAQLAQVINIVFYTGAVTLAVITVIIGVIGGWLAVEKLRMIRAKRMEAEKQANVMTITSGDQVYIRDTNPHAVWRAAHLDPRFYANGSLTNPLPVEVAAWQMFNAPKTIPAHQNQTALLPAGQTDLLAALDTVQRCLVVGASDSGKTTLLRHLVARRQHTSNVIIIDPHAYPGKWPDDCIVVGTGRDYAKVDHALDALVRLMTKRYDEIGRGVVAEMGHQKITILIDEWRAITGNVKHAGDAIKALLTESRKAAFSVFVASHSDRAKPLGLAGEYDLKDGFAVVRLLYLNGQRQATLDTGSGEMPVNLPGPFGQVKQQPIINLDPQPDQTELTIYRLHQSGESLNEIARQVWGHSGGKQTEAIGKILAKFETVYQVPA